MFSRNMHFSNAPEVETHSYSVSSKDASQVEVPDTFTPPAYSITQHYHHSAHLVPKAQGVEDNQMQNRPSLPTQPENVEETLSLNGIDPSCLLPSQLMLFAKAASDQKLRLTELWRISPPEYTSFGTEELANELGGWQHTTFEQEEEMAKLRLNRQQTKELTVQDDMELSQGVNAVDIGSNERECQIVEPYMKSGYEMLAQRDYNQQILVEPRIVERYSPLGSAVGGPYEPSTDPVFQSREWWRHDYVGQQPIEYQYGRFDQMNQFRAPTHVAVGASGEEDEEML